MMKQPLLCLIGLAGILPGRAEPAPSPRPVSYAVNFAGRYKDKPSPVTGVLGPEGARQGNWSNVDAGKNVNSNSACLFSTEITDSNKANPITITVKDFGVDGGNDGGGGPTTTDWERLYNSGLRDGGAPWTITTTVAPFPGPYDVYIYSAGGGRSYGVNTGERATWTSPGGAQPGTFEEDKNYHVFSGLTGPLHIYFADAIEGFSIVDPAAMAEAAPASPIYTLALRDIDGNQTSLKPYEGKPILAVNVASKCGFTPQYRGLESLYLKYKDQGLVVVGFPCNDFGSQEPGTVAEIKEFCTTKYAVTFPLMEKIQVVGPNQHPLYRALSGRDSAFPGEVKWNFEKILISRNGKVLARFGSKTSPNDETLVKAIESELARPAKTPPSAPPLPKTEK